MAAPIVLVGPPTGTPSTDISAYVEVGTLTTEDTGNQADDTASFEVLDKNLSVSSLEPNGRIKVTRDGSTIFNGFIKTLEPAWEGISRRFRVNCSGISELLDKCIIPPSGTAYVRNNSESDRARIKWLLETFGQPFLDAGSASYAYIQTLEPDMPRQNFANLTLRQAIERVLGAASESANYYVDTLGRLHTWDNDHEEASDAPFDIVTGTPSATQVAPSDLRVMWDTSELVNYYYVRGKNAAGSGPESDGDSIDAYGRWQAFIDGPDSDTSRKQRRLGKAALKDTKNPIIRTSFTVEADYCENGDGEIWRPGQQVLITSPAHGMTGYQIRVIRVTTSYLNGLGDRSMAVECGALRANFLGPDQWGLGRAKYPDPSAEMFIRPGPSVIDGLPPWEPIDMTMYALEDWGRFPPTANDTVDYTDDTPAASHVLALPTLFLNDAAFAFVQTDGGDLTEVPDGWTVELDTLISSGTPMRVIILSRRISQDDADTLTDITLTWTVSTAAIVSIRCWSDVVEWALFGGTFPNPAAASWYSGSGYLEAFCFTKEGAALTSPAGFIDDLDFNWVHGFRLTHLLDQTAGPNDPSAFTASAGSGVVGTLVMSGGSSSETLGWLPLGTATGAWWEGGNQWVGGPAGPLTFTPSLADASSGQLTVTSTANDQVEVHVDDLALDEYGGGPPVDRDQPALPVTAVGGRFLFDFQTDFIATAGTGVGEYRGIYLGVAWYNAEPDDSEVHGLWVWVELRDDDVTSPAITVYVNQASGDVTDRQTTTITPATVYRVLFEVNDSLRLIRAKLWEAADPEPNAWDATAAWAAGGSVPGNSLQLIVGVGDGTTSQTTVVYPIYAAALPQPGQIVQDHLVAIGDGSTVTFALPFIPQRVPRFDVDGITVAPLSIDYVAPAVTFTSAPSTSARITWDAVRA